MKLIAPLAMGVAFIGAVALGAGVVIAATAIPAATVRSANSAEIKLPLDESKLRPSTLPGYAIAMQKCAICHSADYVSYQPPGLSQAQWTAEMAKMQHAYGAPISDDEVRQIGAYLAVAYGPAKATDASVIAASGPAVPPATAVEAKAAPATAAAVVDVQPLLNANGCLACHAIKTKIVGPAYHEVAVKYKDDAQALAVLEASIRKGSVGKWGEVPMPPFAGLSDTEIKALAEFVRKQ